jgi:hypothetical protein
MRQLTLRADFFSSFACETLRLVLKAGMVYWQSLGQLPFLWARSLGEEALWLGCRVKSLAAISLQSK